jgi:hypothetical protein
MAVCGWKTMGGCRACLERADCAPPASREVQNEKAGPSTAVAVDRLTNDYPETPESQESEPSRDVGSTTPEPCSQISNANGDNNAASSKYVEKLAAVMDKLSEENQVLRDGAIKSSTSLQLLQSENERLQAEVESLTKDKLNTDSEIEGLRAIEREYNAMRKSFGYGP